MGDFELIKDGGLFLSGGLVLGLAKLAIDAWRSRNQRTHLTPDPLNVKAVQDCVSREDCREKMDAMAKRIETLEKNLLDFTDKLYKAVNACAVGIAEIKGEMKNWRDRQ